MELLRSFYRFLTKTIPSFWYCLLSGLHYKKGWLIRGKIYIIKKSWFNRLMLHTSNGKIRIGKNFYCNSKITSNSVGLIQPTIFNISSEGSLLVIGNNVGISGSTICASVSVTIGDNVLIGSGCLITDSDAHPIDWQNRQNGANECTAHSPVIIGDDVFVGARSIILKGVNVGARSVIGAGSVVTNDVPSDCIVAGNPAKLVKWLNKK